MEERNYIWARRYNGEREKEAYSSGRQPGANCGCEYSFSGQIVELKLLRFIVVKVDILDS